MNTSHQKRLRLKQGSRSCEAVFENVGDRWGHRILIDDEGVERELLCSIEGNDQQAWPPSPPIQALDEHALSAEVKAVLGVGGAGRSHWSASFSTEVLSDENRSEWASLWLSTLENEPAIRTDLVEAQLKRELRVLFVEIACLVKGIARPEEMNLQSSYRVGEGLVVARSPLPEGLSNSRGSENSFFAIQSNREIRALIVPAENTDGGLNDGRIVFSPDLKATKPGGSIGWSYRIAVW